MRSSHPSALQIDRTGVLLLPGEGQGCGQEHPFPHLYQEEVGQGAILADMRGQHGFVQEGQVRLLVAFQRSDRQMWGPSADPESRLPNMRTQGVAITAFPPQEEPSSATYQSRPPSPLPPTHDICHFLLEHRTSPLLSTRGDRDPAVLALSFWASQLPRASAWMCCHWF